MSPNVNDCVVQVIFKFTNKNVRQFAVSSSIILYFQSQNLKVDKERNFNLFTLMIKIERPSEWVLLDFRIQHDTIAVNQVFLTAIVIDLFRS